MALPGWSESSPLKQHQSCKDQPKSQLSQRSTQKEQDRRRYLDNHNVFGKYTEMPRIYAAVDTVCDYLTSPTPARDTMAHINSKFLNTHVIVCANLLSRVADAQGKAYSTPEREEWQAIVETLWFLLSGQRGTVHEATRLTRQLKQTLMNRMSDEGYAVDTSAFFNRVLGRTNSRAEDFKTLIDYLIYAASELMKEREEMKRILCEDRARAREAVDPQRRRARTLLSWCPEAIAIPILASESA